MKFLVLFGVFVAFVAFSKAHSTHRLGTPGGHNTISPDIIEDEVINYAFHALEAKTNNLYARRILKVKEATSQVVAGVRYNFKFELAPTKCEKKLPQDFTTEPVYDEKCKEDIEEGLPIEECSVSIWYRPWDKFFELSQDSCKFLD